MNVSKLEDDLENQILNAGLPKPIREYPTGHGKCRFDFAWPDMMLAVEVEGGTFVRGRHCRGVGYAKDAEKYNEAQLSGWTILRVTTDMVIGGNALSVIQRALDLLINFHA